MALTNSIAKNAHVIACEVYDSKCGSKFTPSVESQIASIFSPISHDNALVVTVVLVQQQVGGVDCGLFAAAFAFHAASGENLRKLQFDQSRMRSHLIRCLEKQALERFPLSTANEVDRAGLAHHVIHLFCTCSMPATYDTKMIACDICEKWFHFKCVGLRKRARLATWVCRKCI